MRINTKYKKAIALILIAVMLLSIISACSDKKNEQTDTANYGKIFYVDPSGNDSNDGTKDAPLASFYGAVAKVREYKNTNGLPDGGIKVEFASGRYKLTSSVKIGAEDSGENGKPIVYTSAENSEVIFDGGITLNPSDFKPAGDDFKARLYSEEAKKNVLEIDLVAAGIWDADDSRAYSAGATGHTCTWEYRQSLYVNNELQNVARWPNDEYGKTEVLAEYDGTKTLLKIPSDRSELWDKETGVRLYGYPIYDWGAYFSWTTSPNPGSGGIFVYDQYVNDRPFYFFNIATELDSPGEYYWDVEANKLYYWPKEGFETSEISFSQLIDPGIDVSGSSYISIDGFIFESFRNSPVYGENSTDITVSDSLFRGTARSLWFRGKRITIDGNEFYNLGGGAVYIDGGDYATIDLSESVITNNLIHDYAQVYTVYNAGIIINGLGYRIAHNEIYNSPHAAILFWGGMTTIEYNYVHDVCSETSDAGALYSGRRWDWGGNEIRYNYICDIIDHMHNGYPNGIYLDDGIALQHIYGNILVNIGGVGITGGGNKLQVIENNVICMAHRVALYDNDAGINWSPTCNLYSSTSWEAIKPFYTSNLWKYAFPGLLTAIETSEFHKYTTNPIMDVSGVPVYNKYVGNVIYDCAVSIWTWEHQMDDIGGVQMGPNERANSVVTDNLKYGVKDADDLFVDAANGDYRLKEDSKVYRDIIDFEKWDYSLIGIQK